MTHDEVQELIDAYALGALEPGEMPDVEAHIATCPECTVSLREARAVADALPLTAPLVRHSDLLTARVLKEIRSPDNGSDQRDDSTRKSSRRWIERLAAMGIAAGLAGVVAWSAVLQVQVSDLRTKSDDLAVEVRDTRRSVPDLAAVKAQAQVAMSLSRATYKVVDDYQQVLNVVAGPDVTHATMKAAPFAPNAIGDVYWDRERQIFVFLFANLPDPGYGKTYQVWLWKEGAASSGGTFSPSPSGLATKIVPSSSEGLHEFNGIQVTVEPEAGSPAPTGPEVIQLPID